MWQWCWLFEVKVGADTAKFTDVIVARLRKCSDLIREGKSVSAVSGTRDRPRVVAPSKTCGHVHPPSVVGGEPSVVLDLLHLRSAGSSSLALPLRPDVRFTACASVHSQA